MLCKAVQQPISHKIFATALKFGKVSGRRSGFISRALFNHLGTIPCNVNGLGDSRNGNTFFVMGSIDMKKYTVPKQFEFVRYVVDVHNSKIQCHQEESSMFPNSP